ncbi:hypothetical protein [Roseobacter ponti]|uniref:Lipoprotein n=1 Tax=Roseobacter ponti TaxID=1891787 RepID=A0A858SUU2_9RHOB|nr:hypothetical protein [Roseobacter ponti]QJF52455.1 hypothetical protein G3256_15395 [Roseobacter ponti]
MTRSGPLPGAVASAAVLLGGCATGDRSADVTELDNTWRANLVPKSSPALMVGTFERFCVETSGLAARETALRRAGYVPLADRGTPGTRAFVVDDTRPAVAVSENMCLVQARARTGQTERFERYVTVRFPDAVETDPAPLGRSISQAWSVPGPAIIATERVQDVDWNNFALIYYRPEGAS